MLLGLLRFQNLLLKLHLKVLLLLLQGIGHQLVPTANTWRCYAEQDRVGIRLLKLLKLLLLLLRNDGDG